VIECVVGIGHSPSVADVESRALPARPQPRGGDGFLLAIDADHDGRVGTAKNCPR